ncbi:MAG: hypothetical protein V3581_01845 [Candidatus Cardinium sp.]|uniref:hypothetical protein n=1 Tax=Candidatus Cardinium sp. TP TaxID=2961955 RepID=UPI0021B06DE4|nr:hypothetical protein [Candidatus Cardinium sp. TP]MCT4697258.1 hypothetical protein [Candidatus Cardinium sp. TP]MDN5247223.1 hypothetical protein [Candidatus Cardinium sp.]
MRYRKWHFTDDVEKQFPLKPPKGALPVFPFVRWHFQQLFTESFIFCPLFYQEKSEIQSIINQYREQMQYNCSILTQLPLGDPAGSYPIAAQ